MRLGHIIIFMDENNGAAAIAVRAENLIYSYAFEGSKNRSLDGASITVKQGEFWAILGHNGCGKTTLARHMNVLLELQGGSLPLPDWTPAARAMSGRYAKRPVWSSRIRTISSCPP